MTRGVAVLLVCGGAAPVPALAQGVWLDLGPVMVTDRRVGVQNALPPARGPGGSATVTGQWARFGGEVSVTAAWLLLPQAVATKESVQRLAQVGMRLHYRVTGPLALEGGMIGRSLSPDPDGEAVGFTSVGALVRWSVARGARIWGRLAYVPWAQFAGGGDYGVGAEVGVGLEVLVAGHLRVVVDYGFQRVDRKLAGPDGTVVRSPVEHDVLRAGVRFSPRS